MHKSIYVYGGTSLSLNRCLQLEECNTVKKLPAFEKVFNRLRELFFCIFLLWNWKKLCNVSKWFMMFSLEYFHLKRPIPYPLKIAILWGAVEVAWFMIEHCVFHQRYLNKKQEIVGFILFLKAFQRKKGIEKHL